MKVSYRQAACDDVVRQFRYYLVTLNLPEIAVRFQDAVRRTVESLREHPFVGPRYALSSPQLQNLRSWPVAGFEDIRVYYLLDLATALLFLGRELARHSSLVARHCSWSAASPQASFPARRAREKKGCLKRRMETGGSKPDSRRKATAGHPRVCFGYVCRRGTAFSDNEFVTERGGKGGHHYEDHQSSLRLHFPCPPGVRLSVTPAGGLFLACGFAGKFDSVQAVESIGRFLEGGLIGGQRGLRLV